MNHAVFVLLIMLATAGRLVLKVSADAHHITIWMLCCTSIIVREIRKRNGG